MAEQKKDEPTITPAPEGVGVDDRQVKPASDMSKSELKDVMVYEEDKDLMPTEASLHEADKTSAPNAVKTEVNNPPANTGRPDQPIIQSLIIGAGAHAPPDRDEFDPQGRPYSDANPKPE